QILLLKTEPADGLPEVAILNFVLSMTRQLHRRRPALFDAEFGQKGSSTRFEHAPQFSDKSKRTEIKDDIVWEVIAERQTYPPNPVQRFLMLWSGACPGQQLLSRQLDRRHVGHVLVVDDQIHRIVLEGQRFRIGLRTTARPTAGFCAHQLKL